MKSAPANCSPRPCPACPITLSSAVCPEIREYERFSTACANAYVQPLMASYLERLAAELKRRGFGCPLYLMTSGGGLTTLATAMRFPVRLVESGPAGGAILSAGLARQNKLDEVLSFDMGGTTAKICFIGDGLPRAVAQVRSGARLAQPQGQRPAAAHPGHRDGGDRRRRRLDRAPGRAEAHPGRPRERRRRARTRLLRPRRRRAYRDRCERGARPHRPGCFRRRNTSVGFSKSEKHNSRAHRHGARPGCALGGGRHRRDRRGEHGQRRARARHRARQIHRALHHDRLRRRGAAACRAPRRQARHAQGPGAGGCERRLGGRIPARAGGL